MKCIIILCIMMTWGMLTGKLYGQTSTFNKEVLVKYMDSVGVKYINFSLAQAIHESANFRSSLFQKHNNMFGMKVSVYRETTAIGKIAGGYAIYASWKDSVKDFYIFQQKVLKKYSSYEAYTGYMYRNYAKDPLYKQKLQKYIK